MRRELRVQETAGGLPGKNLAAVPAAATGGGGGELEPGFHEFASEWIAVPQPELAPKTVAGYRWALELHLLPEFARKRLSEITVQAVDRYKSAKAREGRLGHAQINKTLKMLAMTMARRERRHRHDHRP